MPHLGLGTQGEEKVIQAHFAFSADRQVLVLMMEENKWPGISLLRWGGGPWKASPLAYTVPATHDVQAC